MQSLIIHGTATAKTLIELEVFYEEILDTVDSDTLLPFVVSDLLVMRTTSSRNELAEILGFKGEDPATYFPDRSKLDFSPGSPLRDLLAVSGELEDIKIIQTLLEKGSNLHTFIQA